MPMSVRAESRTSDGSKTKNYFFNTIYILVFLVTNLKIKCMKKITKWFTSAALVAIASSGFAQIKPNMLEDKFHQTMSSSCQAAKQQALAIAKDTSKTTTEKLKNADGIIKNLEATKKAHESIKSVIPAKKKPATQDSNNNIEKQQAEAAKYAASLKEELQKPSPDNTKVNGLTTKISASLDEMEKARQTLKTAVK
jgi:hypothetical protein